jgi:hypothetical protein
MGVKDERWLVKMFLPVLQSRSTMAADPKIKYNQNENPT